MMNAVFTPSTASVTSLAAMKVSKRPVSRRGKAADAGPGGSSKPGEIREDPVVTSVAPLRGAIDAFIKAYDQIAKPFGW